ncbi:MAG: type II methionyl aminopeptidase [Methanomicrobiales archaeon]|nr:type II methionyl aminopeptidase [Methanomicrobiales archaeon]MDI6875976.1 type II methionyl aminopeptidase [Methanomicrobiales archaeon]
MNDAELDLYREAGAIAARLLRKGRDEVRVGGSVFTAVETIESLVREAGADLAFPLNLSINENAAHDTAMEGDTREFQAGDVVKLDLGVHIEGYIADTATTIDLGDNARLVEASERALAAAIERVQAGAPIVEIGRAIQAEIEARGYRPVANLSGHGLAPYQIHTDPHIPNIPSGSGAAIPPGTVFAIEPFATSGSGMVSEGHRVEIYQQVAVRPVRLPAARRLLDQVRGRRGLPFARRWMESDKRDIALGTLVRSGVLRAYPVLHDVPGSLVSQHEHTLIVLEGECIVTTA